MFQSCSEACTTSLMDKVGRFSLSKTIQCKFSWAYVTFDLQESLYLGMSNLETRNIESVKDFARSFDQ